MSNSCGITITYDSTVYELKSVAVTDLKPRNTTDIISVKNDDKTIKGGRIASTSPDSTAFYNRQTDLRFNMTAEDLNTLQNIQDMAGADSVLLYLGRVDLFSTNAYDTPRNVVFLSITDKKRVSPGYWTCRVRVVLA